MCGRFVLTSAPEALRRLFGYPEQPNMPPRHNIAPTQPVPVVIIENGGRHFHLMRWGFIPAWVKDPRGFALLINARAETAAEKPAFRNAFRRRRCLIPADGYYEWPPSEARKRPHFIHRRDGQPFGFAALAETWIGPNGEELDTVAIVTAAAGADLAMLHPRVPVTIGVDHFDRWLDCAGNDTGDAMGLLVHRLKVNLSGTRFQRG
jgi:putative SOS response-associated peptidase YedK